jgi:hypothetical protein
MSSPRLLTVSPFGSLILLRPRVCFRNERLLPSSASRNVNISPDFSTLRILPVVTGVSPLRHHSPSVPSPSLCSLCLCGKFHVFSSLPPLEISLRSFCKPCPLSSIACGLFSQNVGVGWASRMLLRDTGVACPVSILTHSLPAPHAVLYPPLESTLPKVYQNKRL